eukprot:scaffold2819_cov128-Isochrysis_galbana.AAC.2
MQPAHTGIVHSVHAPCGVWGTAGLAPAAGWRLAAMPHTPEKRCREGPYAAPSLRGHLHGILLACVLIGATHDSTSPAGRRHGLYILKALNSLCIFSAWQAGTHVHEALADPAKHRHGQQVSAADEQASAVAARAAMATRIDRPDGTAATCTLCAAHELTFTLCDGSRFTPPPVVCGFASASRLPARVKTYMQTCSSGSAGFRSTSYLMPGLRRCMCKRPAMLCCCCALCRGRRALGERHTFRSRDAGWTAVAAAHSPARAVGADPHPAAAPRRAPKEDGPPPAQGRGS